MEEGLATIGREKYPPSFRFRCFDIARQSGSGLSYTITRRAHRRHQHLVSARGPVRARSDCSGANKIARGIAGPCSGDPALRTERRLSQDHRNRRTLRPGLTLMRPAREICLGAHRHLAAPCPCSNSSRDFPAACVAVPADGGRTGSRRAATPSPDQE